MNLNGMDSAPGEVLRRLRLRAGKTQCDLAACLGVHQSFICRVERGESDLPTRKYERALSLLGARLVVIS